MFTTEELKMICAGMSFIPSVVMQQDRKLQQLIDKIAIIRRHQELHEIMQEFLGVSRQYMIRLSDHDEVDVRGIPMTKVHRRTFGIAPDDLKYVHQGPNYKQPKEWIGPSGARFSSDEWDYALNKPEDRSGVQSEKFRQWMPRFVPIKPSDITTEVMNRILRSVYPNEMG